MPIHLLIGICILLSLASLITTILILARFRGGRQGADLEARLAAIAATGDRLERILREEGVLEIRGHIHLV